MAAKKRDFTTFWIVAATFGLCGLALFGVAIEVLKFVALVKWVFS